MKTFAKLAGASLLLFTLSACDSDNSSESNKFTPIDLPAATRGFVEDVNNFAFKLYPAVQSDWQDYQDNIVISPSSAFIAISMALNGQEEEILEPYLDFLTDGNRDIEALNQFCNKLIVSLPNLDQKSACKIANSIWTTPEQPLLTEFKQSMQENFGAECFNSDFSLDNINEWLSTNTEGMINQPAGGVISYPLFINTLYFKGEWAKKFDVADTRVAEFRNSDGSESMAYYMNQDLSANVYEGEAFSMVSLPFGNGNFEMYFMLPNEDTSISEFISSLDASSFDRAVSLMTSSNLSISLPRFTVKSALAFDSVLHSLGLPRFKTDAYIANPRYPELILSQSTIISVDEKGASIASESDSAEYISPSPGFLTMKFDRPFVYIIRESSTGTIIALGSINKI
ncbi:MAG: hypothetical protein K2M37_06695 [Muribaculaceae bacterium]|nr:hypothetical protein [Muribaculaceae bacterium]